MRQLSMHVLSEANACVVSDYPTVQAPAALALRGSARSADRPVGCDARRCNCVGYALDQRCEARVLAEANVRLLSMHVLSEANACMWSPVSSPLSSSSVSHWSTPLRREPRRGTRACEPSALQGLSSRAPIPPSHSVAHYLCGHQRVQAEDTGRGLRTEDSLVSNTGRRPCGGSLSGTPVRASPLPCKASRRGLR